MPYITMCTNKTCWLRAGCSRSEESGTVLTPSRQAWADYKPYAAAINHQILHFCEQFWPKDIVGLGKHDPQPHEESSIDQAHLEALAKIFMRAATDRLMHEDGCPEGEQIKAGTEQFRRIVENEHRRAARAERSMLADYLRNTGHYAAVDLIRKLPND